MVNLCKGATVCVQQYMHFCVHNVYFNVMVHSIPNKYSLIADRNLVAGGMYTALTIESQNSGLQLQSI